MMEKPTIRRKEREKEARREAILDAAVRLFARKGNYEPTLDDIAAEAELSKGTIYNYFKDKHYLFAALLLRCHERVQQNLEEMIAAINSLPELIRTILGSLRTSPDDRCLLLIFFSMGSQMPEDLRDEVVSGWWHQEQRSVQLLADKLAVLPETRNLTPLEHSVGAKMIISAIHYIIVATGGVVAYQPPPEEIDMFARMLTRALTMEHA
jgi:AcrR family transcriptional regulator